MLFKPLAQTCTAHGRHHGDIEIVVLDGCARKRGGWCRRRRVAQRGRASTWLRVVTWHVVAQRSLGWSWRTTWQNAGRPTQHWRCGKRDWVERKAVAKQRTGGGLGGLFKSDRHKVVLRLCFSCRRAFARPKWKLGRCGLGRGRLRCGWLGTAFHRGSSWNLVLNLGERSDERHCYGGRVEDGGKRRWW